MSYLLKDSLMCNIFPKLEANTLKNRGDMKQIFQTFHSRTKNLIVIMTLTLTLEVFCRSNLFVFEAHCNGVKTKRNDNMTTNCGTINLNRRKMTNFKPISCLCDLDLDLKYMIYEISI